MPTTPTISIELDTTPRASTEKTEKTQKTQKPWWDAGPRKTIQKPAAAAAKATAKARPPKQLPKPKDGKNYPHYAVYPEATAAGFLVSCNCEDFERRGETRTPPRCKHTNHVLFEIEANPGQMGEIPEAPASWPLDLPPEECASFLLKSLDPRRQGTIYKINVCRRAPEPAPDGPDEPDEPDEAHIDKEHLMTSAEFKAAEKDADKAAEEAAKEAAEEAVGAD